MHHECLTQHHPSYHTDQATKAEHWPEPEKVHKWQISNESRFSKDYRQFSLLDRYEEFTSATLLCGSFPLRHSILEWWPLSSPPLLLDRWPQSLRRIVSLAGRTYSAVKSQAFNFSSNTSNLIQPSSSPKIISSAFSSIFPNIPQPDQTTEKEDRPTPNENAIILFGSLLCPLFVYSKNWNLFKEKKHSKRLFDVSFFSDKQLINGKRNEKKCPYFYFSLFAHITRISQREVFCI